jgi:hypothetical protein
MDQKYLHTTIYYFLKGILTREKEEELLSWINSDENNRRLFLQEQARVSGKMVSSKDKTLDKNWKLLQQRVGIGKVEGQGGNTGEENMACCCRIHSGYSADYGHGLPIPS